MKKSDKTTSLVELYNAIKVKDDELKNQKKEFKNLRKKLFEQKKAEVLIKYSEIDFSFAFCNSDLAVKFSLDGTHYVLSINSDLKSIGCFVTLNYYLEKYSEIDKDQFMNLVDKFKGIFEIYNLCHYTGIHFPAYDCNSAFECFIKALDKIIEINHKTQKVYHPAVIWHS